MANNENYKELFILTFLGEEKYNEYRGEKKKRKKLYKLAQIEAKREKRKKDLRYIQENARYFGKEAKL